MSTRKIIARALASAFLAGDFDLDGLVARGSAALGRRWRWLRPLARRLIQTGLGSIRPRQVTIEQWIRKDRGFLRACAKHDVHSLVFFTDLTMRPLAVGQDWTVQTLCTAGELADWLGISVGELDWFADLHRRTCRSNQPHQRHYQYRVLHKKFGQYRLIEAPKLRLKAIQRQILTGILDQVPPHPAAHGFRLGRSIKTFAGPHVGREVVVKLDLEDFFPSITVAQIQALFRTLGYPETIADQLAGLCTTAVPLDDLEDVVGSTFHSSVQQQRRRYAGPHLPQGAPTSPALANLCAYRLDCRLTGLAAAVGATYTRYADDLAFSGDLTLARGAKRFALHAAAIVQEEGFAVHHRKTRIMRQGVRQRIAGLVVNEHLNVPRVDFDRLKAILTNCVRHGPATQNRVGHADFRRHLEGKVSYFEMVSPARGQRLRELLEQIAW